MHGAKAYLHGVRKAWRKLGSVQQVKAAWQADVPLASAPRRWRSVVIGDILDIDDWPVCPDFDEDCREVQDCQACMSGDGVFDPMHGICLELQRRQFVKDSDDGTSKAGAVQDR